MLKIQKWKDFNGNGYLQGVRHAAPFGFKMVAKIQISSDLCKIWFPSRLWCCELISIVWEPCYDPSGHIISCFYTKLAESSFLCRFRIDSVNVLFNSTIRFVTCAFFVNKQFRTCAHAFPNELIVMSYEYCAGQHWILYGMWENQTATYFLRFRLFTYDIMKIFNCISIKYRILATFNIKKNLFWQPVCL